MYIMLSDLNSHKIRKTWQRNDWILSVASAMKNTSTSFNHITEVINLRNTQRS